MKPDLEFMPWPKIGRGDPFKVTITEKIDGTNGCIVIADGEIIAVQSRKRFITPGKHTDNYGFAGWVEIHKEELLLLGDGHHYGEWAGEGIQGNPLKLEGKHFFLFDVFRWNPDNPGRPECCDVVPMLYQGTLQPDTIANIMADLDAQENEHEGIVVYYHAFRARTKHTFKHPDGKWKQEDSSDE